MLPTLAPYASSYVHERTTLRQLRGRSVVIVTDRLRTLSDHFGRRPIHQLNEAAIIRWMADHAHLADSSQAAYLSSIRGFTAWLTKRGHVAVDPCIGIDPISRPPAVPRALTVKEVAGCLRACATDRERVVIWLAVGCALRRAEIAGLRWSDYDDREQVIRVKGKGAKVRLVAVPATVSTALARVRVTTGPIVRAERGNQNRPLDPGTIGKMVTRIMWDAGVKIGAYDGRSTHAFRHTAASDILDECGDLRVVQRVLGHAGLPSTAVYLRVAGFDQMRAAMEGRAYDEEVA